jgi:hypothetical protein
MMLEIRSLHAALDGGAAEDGVSGALRTSMSSPISNASFRRPRSAHGMYDVGGHGHIALTSHSGRV